MKKIVITGGIGAGKTAVLKYLQENVNCKVIRADDVAHILMEPYEKCYYEKCYRENYV
jgi:dephospho-CoA kinase